MENFLEKEWLMKMIKDVSSLKRIVDLLMERGIHAELCKRTKTVVKERGDLSYKTDKNVDITVYIRNGRERNDSGYDKDQPH